MCPRPILALALVVAAVLAADRADGGFFGCSVAVSGDTAVVGSEGESAWVFTRSADRWTLQQKLTASDGKAGDRFGVAVAISGDTVLVGAPRHEVGGRYQQGAAYVFVRSAGAWSEQQELVAADGAADDFFGSSVAVSGDTAFVGAPDQRVGAKAKGSAYVFARAAGVWSQEQELTASDGSVGDGLGTSIAVSETGDTLAVGAPFGHGPNPAQGAVYVFAKSTSAWNPQQKIVAYDGLSYDQFGRSVTVSGDTAVVGTYAETGLNMGTVYVFVRSGGVWSPQQRLRDPNIPFLTWSGFGGSIAVSGETLVVGDYPSATAFVFARHDGWWSQQPSLAASDAGAFGDDFGWSVALSGDTALVGAPMDQIGADEEGSAYVFLGSAGTSSQQAKLTMPRPPLAFHTLTPCRLVDTRGAPDVPIGGPALQGQETRQFWIRGDYGYCGIPATAKALSLNLTVTEPTAMGHVRLFPAGTDLPAVSAINYSAGQTRASNVVIGFRYKLAAFVGQPAGTTVHLVLDVNGYFE